MWFPEWMVGITFMKMFVSDNENPAKETDWSVMVMVGLRVAPLTAASRCLM
jgi:hypothetical protein